MRSPLSNLLLDQGLVSAEQLEILESRSGSALTLGEILEDLGLLGGDEIARLLSTRFQLSSVDLDAFEPDPSIVNLIPAESALHLRVIPLAREGARLTVAVDEPWKWFVPEDVRYMTGYDVVAVVAAPRAMSRALARYYPRPGAPGADPPDGPESRRRTTGSHLLDREDLESLDAFRMALQCIGDAAEDRSTEETVRAGDPDEVDVRLALSPRTPLVPRLATALLAEAARCRASHVLVEPLREEVRVRLRIDGALHELVRWPLKVRRPLTDRIKSMAGLNPHAPQLPQRGRLRVLLRADDRRDELRFRVSSFPTANGEVLVLRRLDYRPGEHDLATLGLEPHSQRRLLSALEGASGLVLIAGPRGSGRSLTLGTLAEALGRPDVHVVDASPDHELRLPGVNQVSLSQERLHDVASLVLARDADLLLWDDAPDEAWPGLVETASHAGSRVLATLAEPDATVALRALALAGVLRPSLARALRVVVAQRRVRRLCLACRMDVRREVSPEAFQDLGFPPDQWGTFEIFAARGCAACRNSGYDGHVGLFEVMPISEEMRELIGSGAPELQVRRAALEGGMLSLRMSGLEKIHQGVTAVDEVVRHTDLA